MPTFNNGDSGQSIRDKLNEILEHISDVGGALDVDIEVRVNGNRVLTTDDSSDFATAAQGTLADSALQSESDTLDSVTDRGATTTNAVTVGGLTATTATFSGDLAVETDTLFVDVSAGKVGVRNNAPDSALDIGAIADAEAVIASFRSGGFTTRLEHITTGGMGSLLHTGGSAAYLALGTDSTERMRIDSSGSLLVGATGATGIGTGTGQEGCRISGGIAAFQLSDNAAFFSKASGYSDSRHIRFFVNGTQRGSITTSGTSTAYNTTSDIRLKENITDAPAGNIDDIKVRSFDWKADGQHQPYGFIAQELHEVFPDAVSVGGDDEKTDPWAVDNSKLVPVLTKAIQEQQEMINELKTEVAALKEANQ